MRLGANEVQSIREEVLRADPESEMYLFGSRVDDSARGGDIDLLVISETLGFRDILRLRAAILDRIGWQQLDLLMRRPDELNEAVAAAAKDNGIRL